jgi:hypothetical protein
MSLCVLLHNAGAPERLTDVLLPLEERKDIGFRYGIREIDEEEWIAIEALGRSFGTPHAILIAATGGPKEFYSSWVVDEDLMDDNGYIVKLVNLMLNAKDDLKMSKLGLCIFSEWPRTDSVRYLFGPIGSLTRLARDNGTLHALYYHINKSYVQASGDDPLLFKIDLSN